MVMEAAPVTGPNLGLWMHMQRKGRKNYGKGGFAGNIDDRNGNTRFDVLADLEETYLEGNNIELNKINREE